MLEPITPPKEVSASSHFRGGISYRGFHPLVRVDTDVSTLQRRAKLCGSKNRRSTQESISYSDIYASLLAFSGSGLQKEPTSLLKGLFALANKPLS